jgi:hypothetical protein
VGRGDALQVDSGNDREHQARLRVERRRARERARQARRAAGTGAAAVHDALHPPNTNDVKHAARLKIAQVQRSAQRSEAAGRRARAALDAARDGDTTRPGLN